MDIPVTFSIHYVTSYGEELYIVFDDGVERKMSWSNGHIWTIRCCVLPRLTRWWYEVKQSCVVTRIEKDLHSRQYIFEKDRFYNITDSWDCGAYSMKISKFPKLQKSNTIIFTHPRAVTLPYYNRSPLVRCRIQENNELDNNVPNYKGVRFDSFDDMMIEETQISSKEGHESVHQQ
ncbi:hypothetical protein KM1_013600 [Entamoeba histolytica HM-3:IMSS]|uniref:Uncharacterized protein n=5 Tax=Entamoeba histolytica TaxID=5759 RepID=C4LZV1_ENTH1|nr:hypothetical protein EHI_194380 [Entamoeba histolytica HM-1:IMSS]EAL49312.1 hypothetical protein EHI_194380 [Entamoeba histolytica HM-1:IMSS]EMD47788.1 Hypothetical protein EHI5A_012010 [Entamoeba histolytica KU27]EMS14013.1 hypothetical protein KM1_013600 [Entamoeba histolytica HM-3:IMSS]ENY64538.1 hypothetical protein EHI7A_005130 [Entamoeba histolytica HM-1:IMSS-A]|eukprot:XP_654701.1 hypothetical protein EHI_194380 [Entamoeba histolytica HM-1:IMSS]